MPYESRYTSLYSIYLFPESCFDLLCLAIEWNFDRIEMGIYSLFLSYICH